MKDLKSLRKLMDRAASTREHTLRVLSEEEQALQRTSQALQDVQEGQVLVQELAQQVQNTVHARIAGIVTHCLQAVFPDEGLEFKIVFEKKRSKTEARLAFVREGMEIDPVDASGGGVVDVASFALRLAALLLRQPQRRKILVLDEPFRFVSVEYRPAVRHLLEVLAREMGIQVLMVTHMKELVCGKVVEVG